LKKLGAQTTRKRDEAAGGDGFVLCTFSVGGIQNWVSISPGFERHAKARRVETK